MMTEQRLAKRRRRREQEQEQAMIIDIPEDELVDLFTKIQDAIVDRDAAGAQLRVADLSTALVDHSQEEAVTEQSDQDEQFSAEDGLQEQERT